MALLPGETFVPFGIRSVSLVCLDTLLSLLWGRDMAVRAVWLVPRLAPLLGSLGPGQACEGESPARCSMSHQAGSSLLPAQRREEPGARGYPEKQEQGQNSECGCSWQQRVEKEALAL